MTHQRVKAEIAKEDAALADYYSAIIDQLKKSAPKTLMKARLAAEKRLGYTPGVSERDKLIFRARMRR